ncbi:MAG: ABC transporter permease [Dehalococcoidia bacterium]|nr:ABC transporter permease [Dehalococcoidia bacterium]MSQ17838.1 ABC transporter permease [Dehalococcoidia bacterium]
MRNYMIRRVGHSFFIIMALMALLFLAINVLGDPVTLLVGEDASQEAIDAVREKFGLNRPMHERFVDFYWDMLHGDFGKSLRHQIDAREMVWNRLPNTAVLAAVAFLFGTLGIPLGMLAARRPKGIVDRVVNIMSFAVISIPEFWLGLMLILIVSVQLDLLPTSGFQGLGPGGWKFMILPALTITPRIIGRNAQITRATMIEEMGKQYVATARAKGLAENAVLYSHVLKNAAISIVTLMGDELAGLMNGATVTEIIFGWPGLGKLLIDAISSRDLPVVTASVLVVAISVMAINLTVDLFYTWLDPRVAYK